ncbi:MAG TPA: phosphopyruvate hydratase [Candidatus Saccharimonadales bacterium]|nr:phosphopyruvate hydratase [Candidatus Saccharimonadales bacterium]
MKIKSVLARQIFDSRGYPTVECDIFLENGAFGRAAVPSGASTGSQEALELRDGGEAFGGKGVSKAVANVNERIAPALVGYEAWDQFAIDTLLNELDGTDNKSNLGANAMLAVSLAAAKAQAASDGMPLYRHIGNIAKNDTFSLPVPMLNILNGGKHAAGSTDIQEFMIIPTGAADISEALRMSGEIFHALAKVLSEHGYATSVGDEGGYAPAVHGGTQEALDLIEAAVSKAGYTLGEQVGLALDVAASELVKGDGYDFVRAQQEYSTGELISWYEKLCKQYPLLSLEDGLGEQDWAGWRQLTDLLGDKIQLVADDLLVTNTKLLQRAIDEKSANAILIKLNQIGTLSETIQAVQMAQAAGWRTVISHRSGETEDTTIAHLAVGLNAGQIKTGSFSRSERIAKYNELLRISETLPGAQLSRPFER